MMASLTSSSNNEAVAFHISSVNATDPSLSHNQPLSSSSALLIAVVEWDNEASQERHRCKVPIRPVDLRGRPPHVSGADLTGAIFRRLQGLKVCDCSDPSTTFLQEKDKAFPMEQTTPKTRMLRIYDPPRGDYVPLDPSLPDVVASFGKRTRLLWGTTVPSPTPPQPHPQHPTQQLRRPAGPWLALPGMHFASDLVDGHFELGGLRLQIHQTCDPSSRTSGTVWDGAVLLSRFLERHPTLVRSKRVLELGAGCGLVGLTTAALGARNVCLTDLEDCLKRLERNVRENRSMLLGRGDGCCCCCERIECCVCDWHDPPRDLWAPTPSVEDEGETNRNSNWDVILAADCVWMEELVEPFLNTLDKITERHRDTLVLLSYQRRGQSTHQAFWAGLHQIFCVEIVREEELNHPPALMLLSCRRL